MSDKRYARLKIKMLFLMAVGMVIASVLGFFLVYGVIDGVLQDSFARFFIWVASHLFGQSTEVALEVYHHYIRNNKQFFLSLGSLILMLLVFYPILGRFTRWLDEISSATRRIADHPDEDISLSKELLPLEENLNTIRSQLQAREATAKESERRRQDLVSFLAHDLKTPLTSVVGYLTLLHDDPKLTTEQRAKFTHIALEKARRLEELLSEFFDITSMDLSSAPGTMVPIQLTILLEQLADEFYPIFSEKNLVCHTEIEHQLVVLGEPDKLVRVFDNVLRNAVSYSTPGGDLRISAIRCGDLVEIIVVNEGLEIPEGELANIFEKFYRLDTARSTRTGGAGLGLAIAKEIVEHHHGTIRCESNGRFTSFIISLPLCPQ